LLPENINFVAMAKGICIRDLPYLFSVKMKMKNVIMKKRTGKMTYLNMRKNKREISYIIFFLISENANGKKWPEFTSCQCRRFKEKSRDFLGEQRILEKKV
jgi:hypothetical protein